MFHKKRILFVYVICTMEKPGEIRNKAGEFLEIREFYQLSREAGRFGQNPGVSRVIWETWELRIFYIFSCIPYSYIIPSMYYFLNIRWSCINKSPNQIILLRHILYVSATKIFHQVFCCVYILSMPEIPEAIALNYLLSFQILFLPI